MIIENRPIFQDQIDRWRFIPGHFSPEGFRMLAGGNAPGMASAKNPALKGRWIIAADMTTEYPMSSRTPAGVLFYLGALTGDVIPG
ncbi:MAG TPA: hypothetical protein VMD27_04240 [Candidatus Aquilonibacter sp.]|nr:hypothetical protein [Candidatus Aquilonibacter sp.]